MNSPPDRPAYHFGTVVERPFADVIAEVTGYLTGEGFGVLSTIDLQATLKKKLGEDVPSYTILGACNPTFADQAVRHDPTIGVLLPCNVVVRESGDAVAVDFLDPAAVIELLGNDALSGIAHEIQARLMRIRDRLGDQAPA